MNDREIIFSHQYDTITIGEFHGDFCIPEICEKSIYIQIDIVEIFYTKDIILVYLKWDDEILENLSSVFKIK